VDAALLHHYFGTKADLFGEIVGAPMRPDLKIPEILAGPRDQVGEAILRYVLDVWEQPEARRCLNGLGSFARVAIFDRRGLGLSDPLAGPITLEQQVEDLDAGGSMALCLVRVSGCNRLGLSGMSRWRWIEAPRQENPGDRRSAPEADSRAHDVRRQLFASQQTGQGVHRIG
jgi:hypothetical protein